MTVSMPSTSEVLEEYTRDIQLLLAPLQIALERRCIVVAQGAWHSIEGVALLPFHLHGIWVDRIPTLSLGASFAQIPYGPDDWVLAKRPLYMPADVLAARRKARSARHTEKRDLPHDFVNLDWEEGFVRNRDTLAHLQLPGAAFVQIAVAQPNGTVRRFSRRALGKHCVRSAPCSTLTLLSPRCGLDSANAMHHIAAADVAILNLQAVRGDRTVALISAALKARGDHRPTLVIASSPADVLLLRDVQQLANAAVIPIGIGPVVPTVISTAVGIARVQQERSLDITLRPLKDTHARLTHLAVAAWWEAHQCLALDGHEAGAVRRFTDALTRLQELDAYTAAEFNAFCGALDRVIHDDARVTERRDAVTRHVLRHLNVNKGDVAILVRQPASAIALADHLAQQLGCARHDLAEWGVQIRVGRGQRSGAPPTLVVACGFSGHTTLDAILMSRAPRVALVVDPVEAALLVSSAQRAAEWMARAGDASEAVRALGEAAFPMASRDAGTLLSLSWEAQPSAGNGAGTRSGADARNERQHVTVTFIDGEEIYTDARHRFDRISPETGVSASTYAADLCPGDEVVLVDGTAEFSTRLITSLDAGPYAVHAAQRAVWSMLVERVLHERKYKITMIHARLREVGVDVDYSTVRAWLRPSTEESRTPQRWETFAVLADALGMTLPESELRRLFHAIRALRTLHRKAGRDLVRMIRAARAGHIDPRTLHEVEERFGIGIRDLVAATRVAVIDNVQEEL